MVYEDDTYQRLPKASDLEAPSGNQLSPQHRTESLASLRSNFSSVTGIRPGRCRSSYRQSVARRSGYFQGPSQIDSFSPGFDEEISDTFKYGCHALTRRRKQTIAIKREMMEVSVKRGGLDFQHRLGELGFLNEDLCRVIYEEHRNEHPPQLLCHLKMDLGGGLQRLDELWSTEKYFWFVYLIVSVLFNVGFLFVMNWGIFRTYANGIGRSLEFIGLETNVSLKNITYTFEHVGDQASRNAVQHSFLNASVVNHIHDLRTQQLFLNIAAVVGSGEILWIFAMCLYSLHLWWIFCTDRSEYRSYKAVMDYFQKILPQFSTFSAVKLMTKVHPSLLYHELLNYTKESSWRATRLGRISSASVFLLIQFSFGAAALCALAIKILVVGLKLLDPNVAWIVRICNLLALMVQCMGCILMEQVLQDRLFLFVFGGQDATYQDDEQAYKNVYQCRIAKQIWIDLWEHGDRWSKLRAIVLLATFDHYDLQKLVIEADDIDLNEIFGTEPDRCSGKMTLPSLLENSNSPKKSLCVASNDYAAIDEELGLGTLPKLCSTVSKESFGSIASQVSGNSFSMRTLTRALCKMENSGHGAGIEWASGDAA
mmetsp:Transcript_94061/g.148716  ORF Transcript_94061/g.148716 Transcript_94061/m.148716 type:complete len:596 (-) Transcript_94061:80-1867(-)